MKIDAIEVRLVRIPFRDAFKTSMGDLNEKTAVIVELRDSDGLSGYGEGSALPSPTYTEESIHSAFACTAKDLAPMVIGKSFATAEALCQQMAVVRGNNCAKAAVETAFWDLISKRRGEPLSASLGGSRPHVEVGDSLGITRTVEELVDRVGERVAQGYRRIKLKIQPGWDIEPVRKVRETFPDIPLTVDANAAYRLTEAGVFMAMDDWGLAMIEQPLAYDDLINHAVLQSRLQTPICLDESIRSVGDARLALHLGSTRVINIKTGRVGGLLQARRIHDLCAAHEVPVWMGGLFESGIGRRFNLALASLENFSMAADMSPPLMYFEADLVTEPFELLNGLIEVPDGIGAGFEVDHDALERYTDQRESLSRSVEFA